MQGKSFLLVAKAAHPPPALCAQWAVTLCWTAPWVFFVGLLDLRARDGPESWHLHHPCGEKHRWERFLQPATQLSGTNRASHLDSYLKCLKMVLSMPAVLSVHNRLVSLVCKCIAADLRQALLWVVRNYHL